MSKKPTTKQPTTKRTTTTPANKPAAAKAPAKAADKPTPAARPSRAAAALQPGSVGRLLGRIETVLGQVGRVVELVTELNEVLGPLKKAVVAASATPDGQTHVELPAAVPSGPGAFTPAAADTEDTANGGPNVEPANDQADAEAQAAGDNHQATDEQATAAADEPAQA